MAYFNNIWISPYFVFDIVCERKKKNYKYSGWERWPHLQNDVSDTGGAAALSPVPSTQDHCDEVECSDSSFSSSFDVAKP